MRDKPELRDEVIAMALSQNYGIDAAGIEYLSLGHDFDAWVYRVDVANGPPRFLKLKREIEHEAMLAVPHYLREHGVAQVVAPLAALTGDLWIHVDRFVGILYSFVDGRNGREVGLSLAQWQEFGGILRAIHSTKLPPEIAKHLPSEEFIPNRRYAASVRRILDGTYERLPQDDLSSESTAFLRSKHDDIARVSRRADELSLVLRRRRWDFALCHADIHVSNVLIGQDDHVLIIDWDQPIFAPKERDLMFVTSTALRGFVAGSSEEAAFFRGYGNVEIDPVVLAYYRYEWAVQDIGSYAELVYQPAAPGENSRRLASDTLRLVFEPGGEADEAFASEKDLPRR
jgi:spectinomycin phosphotransferase